MLKHSIKQRQVLSTLKSVQRWCERTHLSFSQHLEQFWSHRGAVDTSLCRLKTFAPLELFLYPHGTWFVGPGRGWGAPGAARSSVLAVSGITSGGAGGKPGFPTCQTYVLSHLSHTPPLVGMLRKENFVVLVPVLISYPARPHPAALSRGFPQPGYGLRKQLLHPAAMLRLSSRLLQVCSKGVEPLLILSIRVGPLGFMQVSECQTPFSTGSTYRENTLPTGTVEHLKREA